MPQNSSKGFYHLRGRLKLPTTKAPPQISLLREYPYVFLAAFLGTAIVAGKAAGFGMRDSFILGAWTTSLVFFGWQLWRYLRHRTNPQAAARREAETKAFLNAKARAARGQSETKAAAKPAPAKPKIVAVPRKPAQRPVVRKPGLNVKPVQQPDETPKT